MYSREQLEAFVALLEINSDERCVSCVMIRQLLSQIDEASVTIAKMRIALEHYADPFGYPIGVRIAADVLGETPDATAWLADREALK